MSTGDLEGETLDLVEVYRCSSPLEADRAVVEVLEAAGIAAFVRDRASHALPSPATGVGSIFIAVAGGEAGKARQLLREALEDRALDREEGMLVDDRPAT